MTAYYNENDPYAAQWLRNLISAGHIAPGDVDERSITDVKATDLTGYVQCHFFAGLGIWSHALRKAGWDDNRPVWTGSCPCQPFSSAGKGKGADDERHLWPVWARLIAEHRPNAVFGEQVSSPGGRAWWDIVASDLERMDYAAGALDTCAAGVGAPHIRQRLYWVAHTSSERRQQNTRSALGDEATYGCEGWNKVPPGDNNVVAGNGKDCNQARALRGFWECGDMWVNCTDGKRRPIEPGTFPLAHGVTQRVGRLRAYGNGLCAPQATEFIKAAMKTGT